MYFFNVCFNVLLRCYYYTGQKIVTALSILIQLRINRLNVNKVFFKRVFKYHIDDIK